MDLQLNFANGILSGDGSDDVGRFLIKGRYDAATRDCHWTKSYLGSHDVFYKGCREGKGIRGTWEIGQRFRGGFHIWPRASGEEEIQAESTELREPIHAVGLVVSPSARAVRHLWELLTPAHASTFPIPLPFTADRAGSSAGNSWSTGDR
jgi:hypothetical protein